MNTRKHDTRFMVSVGLMAAGWLWRLLKKMKLNQIVALSITGFVGSMVNTVAMMGSIYLLFAQQYAQAKDVAGVTKVLLKSRLIRG